MTCTGCGGVATVGGSTYCAKCLLAAADHAADDPILAGADDSPPCELLSLIGETRRAVTYLGEQTWPVRRLVAFKLFKGDGDCPLTHAGQAIGSPLSPLFTGMVERGRLAQRPYALTPFIAGGPMPHCYDRHRVGLAARTAALIAVADAVAQAHAQGIAHGHLAPTNVLCDPRTPFDIHIVDLECNAGRCNGLTPDALMQDDVARLIELVEVMVEIPAIDAPGDRVRQRLRSARSAADVCGALEELRARAGP